MSFDWEGSMHFCVLIHFSHLWLFATPWTVACQKSPVHRILQARILEWVAIFSSRGSSWPRDQTGSPSLQEGFCFFFNHWTTGESPKGFHRQWHFQNPVEKTVSLRLYLSWEPSAHLNPYTDSLSHAGCACLGDFGAVKFAAEHLNLVMGWSLFPRRTHSPGSLSGNEVPKLQAWDVNSIDSQDKKL